MIISLPSEIKSNPLFFMCNDFIPNAKIYLKLEGLNIAGSIKLKTAAYLLNGLEKKGLIQPGKNKIIESSSGNLGTALSILCKEKGYHFCCVTDPNISSVNKSLMEIYGTELVVITERDAAGGFLGKRIEYIKNKIQQDHSYVWTNQYANHDNIEAHYAETAKEIITHLPPLDYLFVGAGTTGTLIGCAKFFKQHHSPHTKIIAVDSVGSVTFDRPASKRYIPGLGTSLKPTIVRTDIIDDIFFVEEKNTVNMCQLLLNKYGLLVGGSTGTVMYAVASYSFQCYQPTIAAISPDFGDKYLETIYSAHWREATFGK